jgi:K+-sensing histidine kinase KdpD
LLKGLPVHGETYTFGWNVRFIRVEISRTARLNGDVGDQLNELLVPYRLRAVRIGVQATWLTVAGLLLFLVLEGRGEIETTPYLICLALTVLGAMVVSLLPWESMLKTASGLWALYAWSVLDIILITVLIGFTGGATSELFVVYFLTTIFFAASYPERGQIGLLVFTHLSYAAVMAATGWEITEGELLMRLTILSVTAFIASFVSRELMDQMTERERARRDSERRALLLQRVAASARAVTQLGPDAVLKNVVDAVTELGFDAAAILMIDESGDHFQVMYPHGLPAGIGERTHPTTQGITPLVIQQRGTVTLQDYSAYEEALPPLKGLGLHGIIAAPLWNNDTISAVLVAASTTTRVIDPAEVEAMELLAAQAERALENAARFEEEHRTVEHLSEVDRLKDDFLSMVSHDLRTPLTVIEGSISTLEHNWDRLDEEMRKKLTSVIGANAHKLSDAITKLLDLTRLDAGHFEAQVEPLELGRLLKDTVSRFEGLFTDHVLRLDIQDPLVVETDRVLVERVVENLLSNAAKYTPEGTKVVLSAYSENSHSVISVRDEGPGIPEEDMARLGERFFRGVGAQSGARGTGLGLAWVLEILKALGSELHIESRVGAGSTFEFELPLVGETTTA